MARGDIRPADPRDVEQVLAMIRELAEYERAADQVQATPACPASALFGTAPAVHALVVEGGPGQPLLGFAIYFLNFSTWLGKHGIYLEDLYVRPDARGEGHGKRLLQSLARICARTRLRPAGVVGAGLERAGPGLLSQHRGGADGRVDGPSGHRCCARRTRRSILVP
jgi:GNAT superfamily N-acetyltransferase